jgi:hypothetical protein
MAKTKRELFSFARKCTYFNLTLVSSLGKRGGQLTVFIARYSDPKTFKPSSYSLFPAGLLRKAFAYAQQKANELGQDVRVVMQAQLKEECEGDEGLFGIKTFKPVDAQINLSSMPVLPCSHCLAPATHQFVARYVRRGGEKTSIVEHGCDDHIESIRQHWA